MVRKAAEFGIAGDGWRVVAGVVPMIGSMIGMLVSSLAGHDKGKVSLVVRQEGERVYLADGRLRLFGRPKCKNQKHVQSVGWGVPKEELQLLEQNPAAADAAIRKWIRQFEKTRQGGCDPVTGGEGRSCAQQSGEEGLQ